jgi:hypothetical protein
MIEDINGLLGFVLERGIPDFMHFLKSVSRLYCFGPMLADLLEPFEVFLVLDLLLSFVERFTIA